MAKQHTLLQRLTVGGVTNDSTQIINAGAQHSLDESIADGATDLEVAFTLDISATKSFMIKADQAMTVKTNDSGSPTDTLSLLAGVPYIWHENSLGTFLLTGDVTALFVTNASGTAGTLTIEALSDPTP